MTNEEAIELLDSFRICVAPTLREAMSVAINALTKEAWKEEHPVSPLLQKLATNLQPSNQDCISRQVARDTAIELRKKCDTNNIEDYLDMIVEALEVLPSAQPEHTNSCYTNSWCIDCKEYDTENKCCPRFNRVIKQTLDEAYTHGETEAEARFHKREKGQWKLVSADKYTQSAIYVYRCDRCGKCNFGISDFCPNCGAEMTEETECQNT